MYLVTAKLSFQPVENFQPITIEMEEMDRWDFEIYCCCYFCFFFFFFRTNHTKDYGQTVEQNRAKPKTHTHTSTAIIIAALLPKSKMYILTWLLLIMIELR